MTMPCLTCRAELDDSYKSCPTCGNEISDFARAYSVKPVNGTYELVSRIGGGGMGEVFRARHLIFGTDFIIKVMKPLLRDNQALQKRFMREALLSRKVRHENVATVGDAGRLPDGALFIVAEFIEGTTFAHVIHAAGRLEPMRCLNISRQVLSGLDAIHAAHLIHRDISPDNIMISPGEGGAERATIIDFGIAKEVGGDYTMTESNLFLGKLRYASPEQLKADPNTPVDGRADLYSFGIMLYQMLTGDVPFSAHRARASSSPCSSTPTLRRFRQMLPRRRCRRSLGEHWQSRETIASRAPQNSAWPSRRQSCRHANRSLRLPW